VKLVEVCEPLFQYVCTLNRSARKGGGIYDAAQVRADLKQILADMKYAASQDTALLQRYEQIELPLLFFVDSMIKRSQLSFAEDWENLAYERRELAGEDRFFEMLDRTLEDKSDAATDKLAVYYTCIGLGFTGWHTGHPEVLRKKMLEISARVRPMFESNPQAYICPDAYSHLNTSNLIQPPASSLGGIAVTVFGLACVLIVAYVYLYRDRSDELKRSLNDIVNSQKSAAVGAAAGGR
jgi:type VI protein secretion system component VasF